MEWECYTNCANMTNIVKYRHSKIIDIPTYFKTILYLIILFKSHNTISNMSGPPMMKVYVKRDTVEPTGVEEEAAAAKKSAERGSPSKKARKDAGESKENKPDFLRYLAEKLAFEEYLLEPTSEDFYAPILGAIARGRQNVPVVQLFREKLRPSALANALVIKYSSGELFFTPKALKLNPSNLEDGEFRRKFLIGERVQVARKEKKNRKTKEVTGYEYVYKFQLDLASLFARLKINADLSYFQKAALEFNPYFTLEEERTVAQEQVNEGGKFTLKFKSPFNETKGGESVPVTAVARYFEQFITGLPDDVGKDGNPKPKDLSRFGDSLFVFENCAIQKALYSSYGLPAPDSANVSFDEDDRFNMSAPSFVDPGDYSSSSGVGGMLTKNTAAGVQLVIKDEDRYFGRPKGTELRPGPLLVLGNDLYEYVDDDVITAGIALTKDLSAELRMKHGMQREGADVWEKKNYM